MQKKIISRIKLCLESRKATPAPPVGSALGQYGVNIMEFCKEFNAKSESYPIGSRLNVKLVVYQDKKFKILSMKIDTSYMIKKVANIDKGSDIPGRNIIYSLSQEQLREIAQEQLSHLNAYNIEQAMKIIAGQARSMGISTKGE